MKFKNHYFLKLALLFSLSGLSLCATTITTSFMKNKNRICYEISDLEQSQKEGYIFLSKYGFNLRVKRKGAVTCSFNVASSRNYLFCQGGKDSFHIDITFFDGENNSHNKISSDTFTLEGGEKDRFTYKFSIDPIVAYNISDSDVSLVIDSSSDSWCAENREVFFCIFIALCLVSGSIYYLYPKNKKAVEKEKGKKRENKAC